MSSLLRKILALVLLSLAFADVQTLFAQPSADDVISTARRYLGTPYRSRGKNPKGFDCSGFTRYIFSQFGYSLNGSAPGQYSHGHSVSRSELQRGDLVFFGGRRHSNNIGHVGIVTEADNSKGTFKFIHSSTSRGVCISASTEAYYSNRYVGARRVLDKEPASSRQTAQSSSTTSYLDDDVVVRESSNYSTPSETRTVSRVAKPKRQTHPLIARDVESEREREKARRTENNSSKTEYYVPGLTINYDVDCDDDND